MAAFFAWTGALGKRGELDGNAALTDFARKLEQAAIDTIEGGMMTKDLAGLWEKDTPAAAVSTSVFLQAVKMRLEKLLEG